MPYYTLTSIHQIQLIAAQAALTLTIAAILLRITIPTPSTRKTAALIAATTTPIILLAETLTKQLDPTAQITPLPLALIIQHHHNATLTIDLAQIQAIYAAIELAKTHKQQTKKPPQSNTKP